MVTTTSVPTPLVQPRLARKSSLSLRKMIRFVTPVGIIRSAGMPGMPWPKVPVVSVPGVL